MLFLTSLKSDDRPIKETIATLFSCDAALENIQSQIESGDC